MNNDNKKYDGKISNIFDNVNNINNARQLSNSNLEEEIIV